MEALLGSKSLPPGIRFHPTDEEIFIYYLKRKVLGKSLGPEMISEVDVFQFDPWELPAKACLKTKDLYWWFICPRSKKYPHGGRSHRATIHGYWKSTGNDRTVNYKDRPVGKIKTLIFHRGKPLKGERTDWVMHEYRLEDRMLMEQGVSQDSYVISKIFEKKGLGPRNGDHYGAPFVEEEWDSDNDDNLEGSVLASLDCQIVSTPSIGHPPEASGGMLTPYGVSTPSTNRQPGTYWELPLPPVDNLQGSIFASEDRQIVSTPSVGPLPLPEASGGMLLSSMISTPSRNQQPGAYGEYPLPPVETEEAEFDRLLAAFIDMDENLVPDTTDFFEGVPGLTTENFLSDVAFDWSQFLDDGCYMELNDLM